MGLPDLTGCGLSGRRTADGGDVVVFHFGCTVQDLELSSAAADRVEAALAPFDAVRANTAY